MPHQVVLYSKEGCCLCDRAKEILHRLQGEFDLEIEEVDISQDAALTEQYGHLIPVVLVDGEHRLESKIAEYYLRQALSRTPNGTRLRGSVREGEIREAQLAVSTTGDLPLGPRARQAIRTAQAVSFWFARHWLAVANGIILAVVSGSAAIPLMMAVGVAWLADPLFGSYRPICHQLPQRSFFLFGHQMAMCERDVAIYGSMALAGLVFALVRHQVEPLPWRWYLLALLPMAVDGLTQLLELRESNWELRLLTGSLFGAATVGIAYPHLDRFAAEIRASERQGTRVKGQEASSKGQGTSRRRTQNSEPRTRT